MIVNITMSEYSNKNINENNNHILGQFIITDMVEGI